MSPCSALAIHRLSPRTAVLTSVLTISALTLGVAAAPPALADTNLISNKADLDTRLRELSTGDVTVVRLGQDLTARDAAHDAIAIPEGSKVTLDLNGRRLALQQVLVSTGAVLEVTDSSSAEGSSNGFLQVGSDSSWASKTPTGISIGSGAEVTVRAASVSAFGSDVGTTAGIGSPAAVTSAPGSLVLTDDSTVRGVGGKGGAGVGGAQGAAAVSVRLVDSALEGRGGLGGAGVGSGRGGVSFGGLNATTSEGSSSSSGRFGGGSSSIDASGGRGAAGIGGGLHASGGVVDIDGYTDANVSSAGAITSSSGAPSVVGAGQDPGDVTDAFGTLSIGRHAWLWANDRDDALIVPAGAFVVNDGSIRASGGLTGGGTVENHGLISTVPDSSGSTTGVGANEGVTVAKVTGHNYAIRLHDSDAPSAGETVVRVLCAYVDVDALPAPASLQSDRYLMGWGLSRGGAGEVLDGRSLEQVTGLESRDGQSVLVDVYARVGRTPSLTGTAMPDARANRLYDQPLPITGDGIEGYWVDAGDDQASGLPAGLRMDGRTGRVTGTASEPGTFRFRVQTGGARPVSGVMAITVVGAPVIATTALPAAQQGAPYSTRLTSSGAAGLEWRTVDGALPDGLRLSADGVLSGVPGGAGISTFTVRAADGFGQTDRTLALTVIAAPATAANPETEEGSTSASPGSEPAATPLAAAPAPAYDNAAPRLAVPRRLTVQYGHRLDLAVAAASTSPVAFGLSGALPNGLAFDARSGVISGVPTQSGSFSIVVTAKNAGGSARSSSVLVIGPVRRLIGARSVPTAVVGGEPIRAAILGLKKGERFRVLVDGRIRSIGTARGSGLEKITVTMPEPAKDTLHRVRIIALRPVTDPATTASTSFSVNALVAKKTLRLTSTTRAGIRKIVVGRLAAGERVVATAAGVRVAAGRATADGTFTFARSARDHAIVTIVGAAASRRGTFEPPRRNL